MHPLTNGTCPVTSAALLQGVEGEAEAPGLEEEVEVMLYLYRNFILQAIDVVIIAIYICAVWGADI